MEGVCLPQQWVIHFVSPEAGRVSGDGRMRSWINHHSESHQLTQIHTVIVRYYLYQFRSATSKQVHLAYRIDKKFLSYYFVY